MRVHGDKWRVHTLARVQSQPPALVREGLMLPGTLF